MKQWEHVMQRQRRGKLRQLVKRASWCEKQLDLLTAVTELILKDEHFVSLLRGEGMGTIPTYLRKCMDNPELGNDESSRTQT